MPGRVEDNSQGLQNTATDQENSSLHFFVFMPNSAQHVLFSIHYLLSTIGRSTQNLVCTFFKKQIVLHEPLSLRLERNACANDWLLAFEFRI